MKYLFVLVVTIVLFSCKPCRECKYSTLKGTKGDKSCSSIKADRDAFVAKWDSLAKADGTEVICTKENY